jgi:transcriptional regulator with XRE-family HTH domain
LNGREFRAHRLRLGLTQEALGRRLGVIRGTVNRWEKGRVAVPKIAALAIKQVLAEDLPARVPSKRR